ncbi:MAG: MarR family transcriptional regulator [Nitrospirales bacterium]|nr:MAG: MarR family transcriptional regulator [Nitrospirales bacterium]
MNDLTHQGYSPEGSVFTQLLFEMFKLYGRFLAEGDKLVQPYGLTTARWKVLSMIALAKQPVTVPQIGRRIGLSRQNVQRLVDVLEEEAFVVYQGNPDHKRAKLVALTEKGGRHHEAIMRKHIPWANQCVEGIKQDDLAQTLSVLKRLTHQLDRM